eukprot:c7284_g1_i1.p1 GENE.c7284_g1_i1~~c7284_g1_i1.p1  ORF type:complete len:478 (-),score=121.92 c7284_g1_i1:79-1512(-)
MGPHVTSIGLRKKAMLALLLLPSLVVSRPLGTRTESVKTILHHVAHNADFVHQALVPYWWYCSIDNFRSELTAFDRGTLAFIEKKGSENPNRVFSLADAELKWWSFEIGILSGNRAPHHMFHFMGEDKPEGSALEWDLPKNNPFKDVADDVWGWTQNVAIDRDLYQKASTQGQYLNQDSTALTPAGTTFLEEIRTAVRAHLDQYCPVDETVEGPQRRLLASDFRPKCVMLKMFPDGIDEISGDRSQCFDETQDIAPEYQFHIDMMDWFVARVPLHNKYFYHDNTHAGMFATTVFHSLRAYRNRYPNSEISDNTLLAATMAGLYHDVGYFLLPEWLKTYGDDREGNDKGHELVSLIAAIHRYNAAMVQQVTRHPHQVIQDVSNRQTMAHIILTTKIGFADGKLGPIGLGTIATILEGRTTPVFPFEKDSAPLRYGTLVPCLVSLLAIRDIYTTTYADQIAAIANANCKALITLVDEFV